MKTTASGSHQVTHMDLWPATVQLISWPSQLSVVFLEVGLQNTVDLWCTKIHIFHGILKSTEIPEQVPPVLPWTEPTPPCSYCFVSIKEGKRHSKTHHCGSQLLKTIKC